MTGAICLAVILAALVLAFIVDALFAYWEPGEDDDS